jgi:murein DD-endopeptidase MepM/ murein hydrolase activator NlpD
LSYAFLAALLSAALSIAQTTPVQPAKPQSKARKTKAPPRKKRVPKPLVPSKPPAEIPEVTETASVWRGCLTSRDVPTMAASLGVEQSRLTQLLDDLSVMTTETAKCVPFVAAKGGEGGAVSALFERPDAAPGESPIVAIRKTSDGITVTPGACDCPQPLRRTVDFPMLEAAVSEAYASIPASVRWQLDSLLPLVSTKLAAKQTADEGPYTIRVTLERRVETGAEYLRAFEVEDATGQRVDGAWWLDRPGSPGVLVGMDGVAYERALWQSPVKYTMVTRGVGPSSTTFFRRIVAPKGSAAKTTTRSYTSREYHLGVDLLAPKGTEVHAVGDARVVFAGRMGGFGKLIILDHGLGYQTYYAHLSVIQPTTTVGAKISRGDIIGLVGSTGHSTAPHLHFETRRDSKYIDPFDDAHQLGFWLLTPDDQERLAMEMLAPQPASIPVGSALEEPQPRASVVPIR